MIAFAAFAIVITYGVFRVLEDYIRRSERSFGTAERVWTDLNKLLTELLQSEVPSAVAQLAVMIGAVTGCGCFVRGVLMSHYLPRAFIMPPQNSRFEVAFLAVEKLDAHQRKLFEQVMGMAIVYDSFRNPLQGWLFRRLLRSATQSEPSYSTKLETQLATASVLSKKKPVLAG